MNTFKNLSLRGGYWPTKQSRYYRDCFGRLRSLAMTLVVALIFFNGCATTGGGKFRNLFEEDIAQNRESVRQGNIPKAIGELSLLLEMDPQNEETRFLRALAYQKMEHYEKAAKDYNELLKYHPKHEKANYNLGMIYAFKIGDKKAALKCLDRFITLNPTHQNAFSAAKTMLSLDKEDSYANQPEFKKTIEKILTDRGIARAETEGDEQKKKKTLQEIIHSAPNSAQAHFAMAKTLEEEGKTEDAIKSYKNALEINPTFALCHQELGRLLIRTGKENEANIHLTKASLFQPPNFSK